jgi:hypothetical protein
MLNSLHQHPHNRSRCFCNGILWLRFSAEFAIQRLRYKDFQLAARPAEIFGQEGANDHIEQEPPTGLFETDSVKDFATQMEKRGVLEWWKKAMGYSGSEGRL